MKNIIMATLICLASATGSMASSVSQSEKKCMADVIYSEARGESRRGQEAVAQVVMNRVKSGVFPSSVCGVIRQKGQFAPQSRVSEHGAYNQAQVVAENVISGKTADHVNGATYFHTPAVSPSWSRKFVRTTRVGSHIFYRR